MQKREGLVVNIHSLKSDLDSIFEHLLTKNGKYSELFLSDTKCEMDFEPGSFEPCKSFDDYIKSGKILYQDVELGDDRKEIPDISRYRTDLINSLKKQVNTFFPDGNLDSFNVFDPKNIPDPKDYSAIRTYGLTKIKDLNLFFKICEQDKIINEWQSVLEEMLESPNYCTLKGGYTSISAFWSQVLKWPEISWGSCIKRLVHTILTIPISSAEAERGFSILKYIRDDRSRLTPTNLDASLRLKINGPEIVDFPAEKYAKRWVDKNHLPSDSKLQVRVEKKASEEEMRQKKYLMKSSLF